MKTPILKMTNIIKEFPGVKALDGVNLELYEGKVKAIGVCNFKVEHLEELKKTAKIMPMVNQVEIHPFSTKNNIINYCKDNNYYKKHIKK